MMSYEQGESLEYYWNRVSEGKQNCILEQLCDYMNQMQIITGNFIGGLDESPCQDGCMASLKQAIKTTHVTAMILTHLRRLSMKE